MNKAQLPIAVDVMGGDHGSGVVVEGAVTSCLENNIPVVLVGNEAEIKSKIKALGVDCNAHDIKVVNASQVVLMTDSASASIRRKPDSSIMKAVELVSEGKASSLISPGNTGAVMVACVLKWGLIDGLERPAISTLIPKSDSEIPTVMLDSGANTDCTPQQLSQFALLGSAYASNLFGIDRPRVGVLSNGSERSKGSEQAKQTYKILSSYDFVNFVGYVEGGDLSQDVVDVVTCDGFVGNVVLKSMEGAVKLVVNSLKHQSSRSMLNKLRLLLASPLLKKVMKDQLHPSAFGGAPLLGLKNLAIIAHGSSSPRAISNGIQVTAKLSKVNLCDDIRGMLSSQNFASA